MKNKAFFCVDQKSIDLESRTLDVVMTTATPDREGDIIEPRGLDFTAYLKNPVVLWAHDMSMPPVGKVLSVKVRPDHVGAKVQFADTPYALDIFRLYSGGFLNAWSIGFLPKRFEQRQSNDTNPADYKPMGFHILEAEVVELSAVPVPANPEALSKALESATSEEVRKSLQGEMDKAAPRGEKHSVVIKADCLDIPEEAFRKTISDRAKGRFPVVFEPAGADGAMIKIEYEAVGKDGEQLVEAKLLSVTLAVLGKAADAPDDSGREAPNKGGTEGDGRPQINTPDLHQMELEVQAARDALALADVEMIGI